MKINYVTMGTNNDPLYYEFWEPVSKIWQIKFNICPILVFVGSKIEMSEKYGDVYYFDSVKGIPDYVLSVWGRFFITKYFLDKICMTVDIDLAPISRKYIIDDIDNIDDDTYVHLKSGIYHPHKGEHSIWKGDDESKTVPACYHVARGDIFNRLYQFLDWEDEIKRLYNIKFSCPYSSIPGRPKWALEELYTTKKIRENLTTMKFFFEPEEYTNQTENICRSNWVYDEQLVRDGYYMHAHLLRPYGKHKKQNDKLLDLITNVK